MTGSDIPAVNTSSNLERVIGTLAPDLGPDLRALRAAEADLDESIKPLMAERTRLRQEIQALCDLAEENASTDADLVALSLIDRGYQKLQAEASALHPYICGYERWTPDPDDNRFVSDLGYYTLLGAHVFLEGSGRGERALDIAQAEPLAQALVVFADRFVPAFPEAGQYPGMVCARILCGDSYSSPVIWYSRDAQQAVFIANSRHEPEATGTLAEVCAKVITWAQTATDDD